MVTALLIGVHALAATLWVGGMFFAYMALRPALGVLEPPARLRLLAGAFARFFHWVSGAIVVLLLSGYGMVWGVWHGFGSVTVSIHLMHGIGWLMIALFLYLRVKPFRRLQDAVRREDWPTGANAVAQIRTIVGINLVFGLVVVAVAASGRYW